MILRLLNGGEASNSSFGGGETVLPHRLSDSFDYVRDSPMTNVKGRRSSVWRGRARSFLGALVAVITVCFPLGVARSQTACTDLLHLPGVWTDQVGGSNSVGQNLTGLRFPPGGNCLTEHELTLTVINANEFTIDAVYPSFDCFSSTADLTFTGASCTVATGTYQNDPSCQGAGCSGSATWTRSSDLNLTAQTNEACDSSIGACSANIVRANYGGDQTTLYFSVNPPQSKQINIIPRYGHTASSVTTSSSGTAQGAYTSGVISLGDTGTEVDDVTAIVGNGEAGDFAFVLNYNGFNFHESQVANYAFTNSGAMSETDIQSFFQSKNSFLAHFYFCQTGGFLDKNNNGRYDPGERSYPTSRLPPKSCLGIGKVSSAAHVIYTAASQGKNGNINPKLLLVTLEKEKSLVSAASLPPAATLNWAMGCLGRTNFRDQISCAVDRLGSHFHDTTWNNRPVTFSPSPFFCATFPGYPEWGVQHDAGSGLEPVGFTINNAATYSLYRYTPYIQSIPQGGGNWRFETLWHTYGF